MSRRRTTAILLRPSAPRRRLIQSRRGKPTSPLLGFLRPAGRKATARPSRSNVNTASAEELERLPHIGPTLSARIIQAREQRPFQSVEELRHVKGIGVKILEELRPFVKVD